MSRQPRNQGQPAPTPTTRQNEYFVPRDGIDREVISADICRYLGNDALVRPGHYENPQTGQVVQGYYITAYRNLTTAMIEDLKADSARWDSERRAQTSRNTSGVQYRQSETHQSRQHRGPTAEGTYQADPYARDSGYDNPRYPGTGAPGYTGATGSFPQQPQPPPQQQQQPYASSSGGAYPGGYQQSQQSPPPDPRFASQAASMMRPGYQANQEPPYIGTGANLPHSGFPQSNDPYNSRLGSSVAAPPQPVYATAPPQQPGYPASSSPYQQFQGQPPAAAGQPYSTMQPHDPFYGRGASSGTLKRVSSSPVSESNSLASPAGQAPQQQQQQQQAPPPGYPSQGQQYDETPHSRSSATPASTQTPSAGPGNRRSDRDSDRHHRPPRR